MIAIPAANLGVVLEGAGPVMVSRYGKIIKFGSKGAGNLTKASIDTKLNTYLLNPNHPVGGSKAKWFKEALGFTQENAGNLAKQIVFDPNKAVQTAVTEFGTKYNQVISVQGANGRVIDVTFAWIRNNDGVIRLITGIPTGK